MLRKFVYSKDRKTFIVLKATHSGFVIDSTMFLYEQQNYESENNRYYRLIDSTCLKSDCDGKLVRKRISKSEYEMILKLACEKVDFEIN